MKKIFLTLVLCISVIHVKALNISEDDLYIDDTEFFDNVGKLRFNAESITKVVDLSENAQMQLEIYHYGNRIASIFNRHVVDGKADYFISYHFNENNICQAITKWNRVEKVSYILRYVRGELSYYKMQNGRLLVMPLNQQDKTAKINEAKAGLADVLKYFPEYSCFIKW